MKSMHLLSKFAIKSTKRCCSIYTVLYLFCFIDVHIRALLFQDYVLQLTTSHMKSIFKDNKSACYSKIKVHKHLITDYKTSILFDRSNLNQYK